MGYILPSCPKGHFFMANPRETEPTVTEHPSYVIMRVLQDVDSLAPEELEDKKRRLRFEKPTEEVKEVNLDDLLVGTTEEGEEYLSIELTPSDEAGLLVEPSWIEKARSEKAYRGTRKIPVRTGYLTITDGNIWEHDPTGIHQGSTFALNDLLRLHFPDHRVAIHDEDR